MCVFPLMFLHYKRQTVVRHAKMEELSPTNLNFLGRLCVNGSGMTTLVQTATRTATADAQSNDQQKNRYPYDDTDDEGSAMKSITDYLKKNIGRNKDVTWFDRIPQRCNIVGRLSQTKGNN